MFIRNNKFEIVKLGKLSLMARRITIIPDNEFDPELLKDERFTLGELEVVENEIYHSKLKKLFDLIKRS